MATPKVTIAFADGNLAKTIQNVDGYAGMVLTGAILLSTPQIIYSLQDAIDLGITEGAEPFAHRQIKEFYQELGGNQKLHIMLVPNTMTMTQMLDITNANGAIKLCSTTNREVTMLAVARNPVGGYNGGTEFFDSDVLAALAKTNAFGDNRKADLNFLSILVEGRVQTPASTTMTDFSTAEANYAGVVVGGTLNDGSASVGLALGRAVKYGAHIKLGKVANGPLGITTAYVGDKTVDQRVDMNTIRDKGVITFNKYPGKAGYFYGLDQMANTGDYALLARRRIVNKAAAIASIVAIDEIEGEVDVTTDGKIESYEIAQVKARVEQQLGNLMADQVSAYEAYIDPDQNIVDDSTFDIEVRILPKGYKSFININVGLATSI